MSQHSITHENKKWVFGWDPPLMSYFLQVHDSNLSEEENPIAWINDLHNLEDLTRALKEHGIELSPGLQKWLFQD